MTEKPGAEIRRRLERMKPAKTHSWLAMRLGVSRVFVTQLISARKSIGPRTAIKLARELGETPEFWARLQADYDVAREHQAMAKEGCSQGG